MTDQKIFDLIVAEFNTKTLGVTEQYLEVHNPVYIDGKLKIDRIDREQLPNFIVAYLPVENEYFSFAIYINPKEETIFSMGTESRNIICLRASSENFTSSEIQSFIKLKPTETWNKGDYKKNKRTQHKFSGIEFILNPEPDEFHDKLKKLLHYLMTDKEGVLALAANASVFIHAYMDFHRGNQLLGCIYADLECIKLLSELNLKIRIDIAAWGEPFKG